MILWPFPRRLFRQGAITFAISAILSTATYSQQSNPETVQDVVNRLLDKASLQTTEYGHPSGISLYGFYLDRGEAQTLEIFLERDLPYLVLAASEVGVKDVDMELRSSDNRRLFGKDEKVGDTADLQFKLSTAGKMNLRIINADWRNSGFCAILVLQKGGEISFTAGKMREAAANLLLPSTSSDAPAAFAEKSLSVIGGFLPANGTLQLQDFTPVSGNYVVRSAASNTISAIRMSIVRQVDYKDYSGDLIATDTSGSNPAQLFFTADNHSYYHLQIMHSGPISEHSAFGITFLLQPQVPDTIQP